MSDREFLTWIHERMTGVYDEREATDYMHKLRAIIASTPKDRRTPNDGRGGNNIFEALDWTEKPSAFPEWNDRKSSEAGR
jgi:hypothetical protein